MPSIYYIFAICDNIGKTPLWFLQYSRAGVSSDEFKYAFSSFLNGSLQFKLLPADEASCNKDRLSFLASLELEIAADRDLSCKSPQLALAPGLVYMKMTTSELIMGQYTLTQTHVTHQGFDP